MPQKTLAAALAAIALTSLFINGFWSIAKCPQPLLVYLAVAKALDRKIIWPAPWSRP
jgi:P2-related tail formation protein